MHKIYIALVLMVIISMFIGCVNQKTKVSIINEFENQLYDNIKKNDVQKYAAALAQGTDDYLINWETGERVDPKLLPTPTQEEFLKHKDELEQGFKKTISDIEDTAGPLESLQLVSVHYFIPHDTNVDGFDLRKYNFLRFDSVIILQGTKGKVLVKQNSCGLCVSGVKSQNPIKVIQELPSGME